MATNTGINTPTITPDQWSRFQRAQKTAQTFLQAATSAAAKSNLRDFQRAFNESVDALETIIRARGGDPAVIRKQLGGTSITVDGLWGPQTAKAMGMVLLFSFPKDAASKAVLELVTANVLNNVSGAQPLPRNRIVSEWYPKHRGHVSQMVWTNYATPVINTPTPSSNQTSSSTVVTNASSSQASANRELDIAEDPTAPTPAQVSTQKAGDFEPVTITAPAPQKRSFIWLWVSLGAAAVGGGLWWMFGRKGRR